MIVQSVVLQIKNGHGAFSTDDEYSILRYKVGCLFFSSMSAEVLLYLVHTVHRCLLRLMVHFVTCVLAFSCEIAYICMIDLCFQISIAVIFHLILLPPPPCSLHCLSFSIYSFVKVYKVIFHILIQLSMVINLF